MRKTFFLLFSTLLFSNCLIAQNSMTGDGFGGRGWYQAHNYQVGSYSAYTVCGSNNQLYGWGNNSQGELGNGLTSSSVSPVAAIGMTDVKFYTSGYICGAIKTDNTAWIWGLADYGNPNSGFTATPHQVLSDVRFMDAGGSHVVFLKNDSTVWGAGLNLYGQLGSGTQGDTFMMPVKMMGITKAVRAIAVRLATIILLNDGTVKICGGGGIFQPINSISPVPLAGLNNIVDIKGHAYAAVALDSSGSVFAFGLESYAGLGISTGSGIVIPPTRVNFPAGAAPIVALSANDDGGIVLALDSNHNVYGWGENGFGQLGNSAFPESPTLLATNAIDIFAGETFSYILKTDGTLWATGSSLFNNTGASIWMNLPNIQRNFYTQINPSIAPMNLCAPIVFGVLPLRMDTSVSICFNQTYLLPSGVTVSTTGAYADTIRGSTSLDSIIHTINLVVNNISINNNVDSIDAGQTYTLPSGVVVNAPGIYQSILLSSLGCDSVITTDLRLKTPIVECLTLINNAFSPNGDGINDYWVLYNSNCFKKLDVNVYNRYGSLVYHANDYKNDWQGTFRNKPIPDGTYYYVINLTGTDGRRQVFKGNVTIIR